MNNEINIQSKTVELIIVTTRKSESARVADTYFTKSGEQLFRIERPLKESDNV